MPDKRVITIFKLDNKKVYVFEERARRFHLVWGPELDQAQVAKRSQKVATKVAKKKCQPGSKTELVFIPRQIQTQAKHKTKIELKAEKVEPESSQKLKPE